MELDVERCYQAVVSRDARFDGRFFTAVVTTGIYCRPVCPTPPPRLKNVRFFACAAAAESAGYRPCKRCRPEASPGTPAWLGASAVVSRALRLISDGALDQSGVDQLAERLGIGSRQLRRLFAAHLGATPLAIARVRRAHFARRLIDESDLPIANIAFASGFNSVRQFNQSILEVFGEPPTLLRDKRKRAVNDDCAALTMRLPYRPPLDWSSLIEFLRPRATPGVEVVDGESYRRTIDINGRHGMIEVRPLSGESDLLLQVRLPIFDKLSRVVEHTRRMFDLHADPLLISDRLRQSPILAARVDARPGLRVPGAWDPFEAGVRAVLGQQITVRAATTFAGRLAEAFGKPVALNGDERLTHLFPTAEALAEADMTSIGLTRARAATLRNLATAVATGRLELHSEDGLETAVARLCRVPGIGEWTANYIAMRAFGEPDAFPAADLGIAKAINGSGGKANPAEMIRMAEAWRPWRAYATLYLWSVPPGGQSKAR